MGKLDAFKTKQSSQNEGGLDSFKAASSGLDSFKTTSLEQVVPEAPIPEAGDLDILGSLERGAKLTGSNILEAVGLEGEAKDLLADAPEASIPNFRQITGAETTGQFIAERTLESAPNIALSGTGAGIGFMLGGPIGSAIGFALGAGVPLLGEARKEIKEEGGEGTVAQAIAPAFFNTAMEAVPLTKLARTLGVGKIFNKSVKEVLEEAPEQVSLIEKSIRTTGDVAQTAATEGVVEGMQELNNKLAGRFFADKEVLALADEDFEQLKQAFAGGLAGGAGSSIVAQPVGAALAKADQIRNEKRKEAFLGDIDQVLQKEIQKKKAAIEGAGTVLKDASDRWNPDEKFSVFEGIQSFSDQSNEWGTLPVGKTGFGPAAFIYGHNQREGSPALAKAKGLDINFDGVKVKWGDLPIPKGVRILDRDEGFEEATYSFPETEEGFSTKELHREVMSFIKSAAEKLGLEGLNIVVGDMHQSTQVFKGDSNAKHRGRAGGDQGSYEGLGRHIGINYAQFLQGADSKSEAIAQTLEVAAHELGHAVISHRWNGMSDQTKQALLQGYRDWLGDTQNLTREEWSKKYDSPLQHKRRMRGLSKAEKEMPQHTYYSNLSAENATYPAYLSSFDEYAAQMMAKALTGDIQRLDIPTEAKSVLQEAKDLLMKLWESVRDQFAGTKTFNAFVEDMFLRKELSELEAAAEEIRNPSGERKASIDRIRKDVLSEHDESKLSQPEYSPQTMSALANSLDRLGLKREARDMRQHQDVMIGFMKLSSVLTPLQIAELAKKHGIQNPSLYMDLVKEFSNTKMKQVVRADEIAQKWRALGKTKSTQLGNFLFAVSDLSDEKERRLRPEELDSLREKHSVDEETFALWEEIDGSFQETLDGIERGLILDAAKSFIKEPGQAKQFRDLYMQAGSRQRKLQLIEEFTGIDLIPLEGDKISNPLFDELGRINASIKKLKQRNYFPRTRMGQYTITIRSTKANQEWEGHESTNPSQTLGFYSFESKRERDAMLKSLTPEAKQKGLSISGSIMDTEVFAMMGMPEVLIQQISSDPKLKLTNEQQQQLKDISLNLSPGKRFLRHLKKRRGIAGFNTDALRVYSNYMMSAANHLARVEHAKSMVEALNTFKTDIRRLEDTNLGGDIGDLVKMKDYFNRHFDYLMKPDNDWAQMRSVGFLWYLGFNVKSALVNLTQIPMVTYPVMAGRFGDRAASKALAGAYRDIPSLIKKNKKLADDEMAMLEELKETGILDESMVMELAGMGEADILKRAIPGWDTDNILTKVSYYGGAMFRMAEKFNRHVTALSAYRLAKEKGLGDPVGYAREVIEKSQFEYSKWNRAEFMRGKKSVIFLFWQYMQHASFLFFGGEGSKVAMRMWMLALFIAGVEGLPFAKTILQVLDLGGTQMQKALGVADPRVALEEDMRDLLLEITDQPDLILNGMASYWGLGPLHLLSLAGAPIPNVDISGSLSFGSPIPFLEEALTGQGSPDEELGKLTAAILGPVGGMVLSGYKSATSTDPNDWKRLEKAMPVFFKNAMQGARWASDGKETFRGGGEFLNMDRPEHRVSALMKALGFQSTRLTQKYKQVMAAQEAALFYTLRKQMLMEDYAYAIQIKDREAKKDVMTGIKKHNKAMRQTEGLEGLAISSKDMKNSIKMRQRSVRKRELGIAPSERQQPLFDEMRRLFPVNE